MAHSTFVFFFPLAPVVYANMVNHDIFTRHSFYNGAINFLIARQLITNAGSFVNFQKVC